MKSVKSVNVQLPSGGQKYMSSDEFWKKYDAGEFREK
jgi:hypothetical protein